MQKDGFIIPEAKDLSAEAFMAVLYHEEPDHDWDKTPYGEDFKPYPNGFPINPKRALRQPLSEFRARVFQEKYFETEEYGKRFGEEAAYQKRKSKALWAYIESQKKEGPRTRNDALLEDARQQGRQGYEQDF